MGAGAPGGDRRPAPRRRRGRAAPAAAAPATCQWSGRRDAEGGGQSPPPGGRRPRPRDRRGGGRRTGRRRIQGAWSEPARAGRTLRTRTRSRDRGRAGAGGRARRLPPSAAARTGCRRPRCAPSPASGLRRHRTGRRRPPTCRVGGCIVDPGAGGLEAGPDAPADDAEDVGGRGERALLVGRRRRAVAGFMPAAILGRRRQVGAQRDRSGPRRSRGRSIAQRARTIICGTGRGWISNECCTSSCSIIPKTCSAAVATCARSDGCAASTPSRLAARRGDRGRTAGAKLVGDQTSGATTASTCSGMAPCRSRLRHDREDACPGELAGGAQLPHRGAAGPSSPSSPPTRTMPGRVSTARCSAATPDCAWCTIALRSEGRRDELTELGVAVGDQHRRPIGRRRPVAGPRHAIDHGSAGGRRPDRPAAA